MFVNPRLKGDHYKRMFDQPTSAVVDRAVSGDGTVSFDPSVYKDKVMAKVSAVFSGLIPEPPDYPASPGKPVRVPGVSRKRGRAPNVDVRHTGHKPAWWDAFYSRGAKGIPPDVFGDVMRAATHDEVYNTIARSAGGKSAGFDGCPLTS